MIMKLLKYVFCVISLLSVLSSFPIHAAIIYSGELNTEGPNFSIDINADGTIDFLTEWRTWAAGNGFSISGFDSTLNFGIRFLNTELPGYPTYPGSKAPLDFGILIGPTPPEGHLWNYSLNDAMLWCTWDITNDPQTTYEGAWHDVHNKYLGFELTVGSELFYGWMQISTDDAGNFVLVDYAYEDSPFTAINAGSIATPFHMPGDVNSDEVVDLIDLIICCKMLAGMNPISMISVQGDVNEDNKIGVEEMIFILQLLSILDEKIE